MGPAFAAGVVFVTSAAVLILEILALRLLAPYVGITLEAYTAVIGTMLAGIAAGTWAGGAAADRASPARLLGPLLVGGGALTMVSVPLLAAMGDPLSDRGATGSVLALALAVFFAPAAVLSAVSPAVVKLQLHDYADLRVMPTWVGKPLQVRVDRLKRSA